jgi:hypothetical protein
MKVNIEKENKYKQYILEHYTCDIEAGKIYNKKGEEIGYVHDFGYVLVSLPKIMRIRAHRIVWLFAYGEFPDGFLDHIDGNRQNNSIKNLRRCNQSQNAANKRKTTKKKSSKYKGVTFRKDSKKWRAIIRIRGLSISLGSFSSEEEAAKAYNNKLQEIFGEFANINIIE